MVISPLSLAIALQMAGDGADGATSLAFEDALMFGKGGKSIGELARKVSKQDKNVTLRAPPTRIWLAKDAKVLPAYVNAERANFRARVEMRDFANPKTVEDINRWFSRETQKLIPNMLSQLPSDARVVLANALYFKGRWAVTFPAAQTKAGPFWVAGKHPTDIPLMRQLDREFALSGSRDVSVCASSLRWRQFRDAESRCPKRVPPRR